MAFDNTRKALEEYDADAAYRKDMWERIESNEDVDKCVIMDQEAIKRVCRAYYEDTKHINSLDNCLRCEISFMRRMTLENP